MLGMIGFDFGYGFDRKDVDGAPAGWKTHFQFGPQFTNSRSQGQKTEPKMSSDILGLLMSAVSQNSAKLYLIQFSLG